MATWATFAAVLVVLILVTSLLAKKAGASMGWRAAAAWSLFWIGLAVAFGIYVYVSRGAEAGASFFAGYLIEKSLSIDNLFVFTLIFRHFAISPLRQSQVLNWGLMGALVLRALFIVGGTALMQHFHWILYVFGALLLVAAWKMLRKTKQSGPSEGEEEGGWMLRLLDRWVGKDPEGSGKLLIRVDGKTKLTPFFAALCAVELSDIIFAVDSVPAVLAISSDPFIVYTSNVFAVLGLRSLYFLLEKVLDHLPGLDIALAAILGFVGMKMLLADVYHISTWVSLGVIVGIMALCALWPLFRRAKTQP